MNIRKWLLGVMTLCACIQAKAQYSSIEMMDGKVYYGYIAVQQPGKNIVLQTVDNNHSKLKAYSVTWNSIYKITKSEEDLKEENCYDEVILDNGEDHIGWIVEQQPGKRMVFKDKKGKNFVFPQSMVRATRKVYAGEEKQFWKNRNYTNELELNDGSNRVGVIVYQEFGKSADESYVELLTASGSIERVYYIDITKYRCVPRDK